VLKEFPDILKFVMKHHYSIDLSTNGIFYEKYIPKALRETPNSYMIISVDAGTRETFKKIKGVDEFDNVIKNLAKYVKEAKETSNRIMAKYMILEGINDNREEIDKWIEVCQSIGITSFFPDIEFCHAPKNSDVISDNVCEMYEYIKERIRTLNPKYSIPAYDFVDTFIKNKSFTVK
jgi:MoaA/NifB/PqqE/SkfB family radical SAM enzyme